MLSNYYRGIPEQQEEYSRILELLRQNYQIDKTSFSKKLIQEINELKIKIDTFDNIYKLTYKAERSEKLTKGAVVYHIFKHYIGVIDGTTTLNHLFEDKNDDKEFRIRIFKNQVKIASAKNLKIIGSAYTHRCYRCKSYVGYTLEKCNSCGWYICLNCNACGCQYRGIK
jgi:hypothetical protein